MLFSVKTLGEMKIIHTADLHLGQVLYQNYGRTDEHEHFFEQLEKWCEDEKPDALVVSGDVFDTQQPSASSREIFTKHFVKLHDACPSMRIIVTAGNHDSASRLEAERMVWERIGVNIIGLSPAGDSKGEGWMDRYIIPLESGYVVAMPYMAGSRRGQLQAVLDKVGEMNDEGKPVVMMAHTAVTGCDVTGHGFDIGTLKTQGLDEMGTGWDYLALGHIHKPQTLGHEEDRFDADTVRYPAPVARYSGSALHVTCDEAYPHSVSIVEIDRHGGEVAIKPLRINELRHFHILPEDGPAFKSAEETVAAVRAYVEGEGGYFRLRISYGTPLPSNFSQTIYDTLGANEGKARFNPKIIWEGAPAREEGKKKTATFQIADLQQMEDPVKFIEKTIDQYQGLDLEAVREAFDEVAARVRKNRDEEYKAKLDKKAKKSSAAAEEETEEKA